MAIVLARFPEMTNLGIYNCRRIDGSSAWSVHAEGRAADIGTGTGRPTMRAGWLAEQLRVFSRELGIQGLIYKRWRWFSNSGPDWKPYGGNNPHTDHIHAEQTRAAAAILTATQIRAVLAGPSVNGSIAGPILKLGAHGQAVRDVQERLDAHALAIDADGVFGPATKLAVERFQVYAGIVKDGVVGPVTRGRLR
jgi:hypothetical protein